MVKRPQTDASEVISLVAGLSQAILTDAQSLRDTLRALEHDFSGDAASDQTTVLPELQASFKTLAQCVFLLRAEIDRISAIASTIRP